MSPLLAFALYREPTSHQPSANSENVPGDSIQLFSYRSKRYKRLGQLLENGLDSRSAIK
jgi:hypothetical protein